MHAPGSRELRDSAVDGWMEDVRMDRRPCAGIVAICARAEVKGVQTTQCGRGWLLETGPRIAGAIVRESLNSRTVGRYDVRIRVINGTRLMPLRTFRICWAVEGLLLSRQTHGAEAVEKIDTRTAVIAARGPRQRWMATPNVRVWTRLDNAGSLRAFFVPGAIRSYSIVTPSKSHVLLGQGHNSGRVAHMRPRLTSS